MPERPIAAYRHPKPDWRNLNSGARTRGRCQGAKAAKKFRRNFFCGLEIFRRKILVRHVINAGPTPWVASQDAPDRQIAALDRAVLFQRLKRIGGTCRLISTAHPYPRRQHHAVRPNGQRNDVGKRAHSWTFFIARRKSATSASKGSVAVMSLRPTST